MGLDGCVVGVLNGWMGGCMDGWMNRLVCVYARILFGVMVASFLTHPFIHPFVDTRMTPLIIHPTCVYVCMHLLSCRFRSLLAFRHAHRFAFGKSDLFFLARSVK